MTSHHVSWEGGIVSARVYGSGSTAVLLAHGAGTNHDHAHIVGLAEGLASHDLAVVTFNYLYTEAGRRAPDRTPVLLACHRAVAAWARQEISERLVLAGRSMGGRMASMLAAEGEPMAGLILYAYPLHPAGRPESLRIEHLPLITVPMLFFQGDRDALARSDLFDQHIRRLSTAEVVDMEGVDHSWRGRGRSQSELLAWIAARSADWIARLASNGPIQA